MATIKVNSAVMRDKANEFKQISTSIKNFTQDMTNEVESLRASWEGQSAETLISRFKGLSKNFEEICNTINGYADFLEKAANDYEIVEKTETEGANNQSQGN